MIELLNIDCMEYMATCKDKQFDLAFVDPAYGIGEDGLKNHSRGKCAKPTLYTPKKWDRETVTSEYIKELRRISKHQIIWGANHFISRIPFDSSCWIVWDKENTGNFADCELAWTSFKTAVRKFEFRWNGMLQGNMKDKEIRIHPTQKPVALYDWIFSNYAEQGMKILDTHLGSGSSRISADKCKMNFWGCELDKEYFEAHEKRWKQYKAQLSLF